MNADQPRAEATIDLGSIRHNLALLASRAADSGAETMAVVKADGYGHGMLPVARAAVQAGASWVGCCSLDEALALRRAGLTTRLFSWLDTQAADFVAGVAEGIDLSVSSYAELTEIANAARTAGSRARVHLKIDTGLSRNGCPASSWLELVDAAAAERDVDVIAVWSHLACADEPGHPSIEEQAERFESAYDIACAAGLRPARHLANSAATLTRPDLHFDIVRVGIAMYGLNPVQRDEDLRPAMTFRSSVVLTKRIAAGESVSYGHTWTATSDTTLALVPVGYADGVPRTLSGKFSVWLGGCRRPAVGTVCMDQLVVDCADYQPEIGSEVILFGTGDDGGPTATEWANIIGTIDYEIVTGMFRPRVQRRYLDEVFL